MREEPLLDSELVEKSDRLDADHLRRKILLGTTALGASAFLAAALFNRPGGLEGEINRVLFPVSTVIAFSFFVFILLRPQRTQAGGIAAYLFFNAYMVAQFYLTLFWSNSGADVRVNLYPLVPWIPVMMVFAFAIFDRGLAVRLSVIYYIALLAVAVAYLFVHPEVPLIVRNALVQQVLLSNATYILMLIALGSVKERYFEVRLAAVRLEQLAFTDELTGLPNRRAIKKILLGELARLRRHGTTFSVMVLDFDHFKRVNDRFGHASGDVVLKGAGRVMSAILRESDWCGRWGGEEFVVILSGSPLEGAAIFAERLRAALANHRFGNLPSVTASFGATEAVSGDDILSLFKRADQALYQAKEKGRNCVVTVPFTETAVTS